MDLGRQLRALQATAVTRKSGRCYSACVFLVAGAVYRSLFGPIGIHRPFSMDISARSYKDAQIEYERIGNAAKAYLHEVNVSPSLYDAMIEVPPQQIRTLTGEEMDKFGLLETDPVRQDMDDNAIAQLYGFSKLEYLRRKAAVEAKCARQLERFRLGGISESGPYERCMEAIMGKMKIQ